MKADIVILICLGLLLIAILLWVVIKVLEYIKVCMDLRKLDGDFSEDENYFTIFSGYDFENDNQNHDSQLMELHKTYRELDLGALEYNGKIYDTNFIDGPHLITREVIASLRDEYDSNGKMSDKEIADSYVRHMRRKYGVTDAAGNWLGLLGEEEID